jgi:hypothetical protein
MTRKGGGGSPQRIAAEIRKELRGILRLQADLRQPLDEFRADPDRPVGVPRFSVHLDRTWPKGVIGLRTGALTMKLPDERIQDQVLELAKAVWHLKDRLRQWAKATRSSEDVEAWAERSIDLRICADLANWKKHGRHQNVSRLDPQLDEVTFDTSRSGVLELQYDGATKKKTLLVSNTVPIPFHVDVLVKGGGTQGNAAEVIARAFGHWLPLVQRLGVLAGSDPESEALRRELFASRRATPGSGTAEH